MRNGRRYRAETADIDFWVQYYASRGIRLVPLPHTPVVYDVPHDVAISHRTFIWHGTTVHDYSHAHTFFFINARVRSRGRSFYPRNNEEKTRLSSTTDLW